MKRAAALAFGLLLALACERQAPVAPLEPDAAPRARVTIGIHVIDAEIADTLARRQRGLSGRASLPAGQGMLFVYEEPGLHGFWMPDMHFDIDILWIRAGRIVHVESDVPHTASEPLPVYRPREPADVVLELPAGTARRLGFRPGDAVQIEGLGR
ncbi:MAG: DUF192 domain-containing protein [Myxococcota bacterium]